MPAQVTDAILPTSPTPSASQNHPCPSALVSAAHLTVVMAGVDRSQNIDKNRDISLQKYRSNRPAFSGSFDLLSNEVPVCIYARNTKNLKM